MLRVHKLLGNHVGVYSNCLVPFATTFKKDKAQESNVECPCRGQRTVRDTRKRNVYDAMGWFVWRPAVTALITLLSVILQQSVLPFQYCPRFHSGGHRRPLQLSSQSLGPYDQRHFFHQHKAARVFHHSGYQRRKYGLVCTAVAFSVTSTSAVEEGDDDDADVYNCDIPSSKPGDLVSALGPAPQNGTIVDSESDARTVVGDIVLSDWLDVLPRTRYKSPKFAQNSGSVSGKERVRPQLTSYVQDGRARERTLRNAVSSDQEKTKEDSAPFKFQELIQRMWAKLSQGDQLAYLGTGQARVKGALTVLAAYSALREHPLQSGVSSPQQAFYEMDINRDGEVSFDEFVRWYSMSSALDKPRPTSPEQERRNDRSSRGGKGYADPGLQAPGKDTNASSTRALSPTQTALALTGRRSVAESPKTSTGASRLVEDLRELSLTTRPRRSGLESASKWHFLAPWDPTTRQRRNSAPSDAQGVRESVSREAPGGRVPTEAEKDACRELWLAGGLVEESSPASPTTVAERSASEDLERALEILCVLVKGGADADTLIAALASCMIRHSTGRYDLEVIEEQFGPIIRGIVQDRLLLERLPEPPTAESHRIIRQSRGVKAVLDMDDNHAKLMREYLIHSSRDARAVVVHMADLTYRLRERHGTPVYALQSLALEALQLYVPVSNALGLGASFRELEELGYKTLFPQTYATLTLWHDDIRRKGREIMSEVQAAVLQALGNRTDIASKIQSYRVEGRTKELVSTFRKVFRQNKRATDVHDIIGLRIIVEPLENSSSTCLDGTDPAIIGASRGADVVDDVTDDMPTDIVSVHGDCTPENSRTVRVQKQPKPRDMRAADEVLGYSSDGNIEAEHMGGSQLKSPESSAITLSAFTFKTFPPPYRDVDSRLLHDVYEVLVDTYEEVPGRYKNYVDFPKPNGYRSVHTTVKHEGGFMMEIQVRTAKMHAEAEGGDAAHSLYKGDLGDPGEALYFRSKMAPPKPRPALQGGGPRGDGSGDEDGNGGNAATRDKKS